ncbi:MAG: hypothetical protein RI538_06165 [Salibaculum sp.]|jgi:hypothetical protein|nr:hypothetical protein [Salibaculum sp.]MDR9428169.1 hypothetical protein [Salibaculum sp.]MDR9482353.1 hypothetical protein [Salibaculum sp.]
MVKEIRQAIARSRETLVADAFGAAALMVLLLVALHLPALL